MVCKETVRKNMKKIAKIIDTLIIIFKCLVVLLFLNHNTIQNHKIKEMDAFIMIPFMCYSLINLLRILFLRNNLIILFIEFCINIFAIFYFSDIHLFYLVLTIVSIIIVYFTNKINSSLSESASN